jgi:hypothetical protein
MKKVIQEEFRSLVVEDYTIPDKDLRKEVQNQDYSTITVGSLLKQISAELDEFLYDFQNNSKLTYGAKLYTVQIDRNKKVNDLISLIESKVI